MALLELSNKSFRTFNILFWLTQVVGIAICATTVYWIYYYRYGLGIRTDNRTQEVNVHIVFAVIGMVYFCAMEMLSFRVFRWMSIKRLKIVHAVIGFVVVLSTVICVGSIYDEKNFGRPGRSNFNSLHSWMGIMVVVLFVAQWVFSLVAYLYPKLSVSVRIGYLPFHVFFGIAIFILLIADVELGYAETIGKAPHERMLMNSTSLLLTVFAGLVVYLTVKQNYKRMPLANEDE